MKTKYNFPEEIPVFTKKFGELNRDKIFYVIRQPSKNRGLFSLFSSVLCHLDIAESLNAIPVIDFQNFPCVYNDNDVKEKNSWEYYFEPVSEYELEEVYSSRNVLLSHEQYPEGYSYCITHEDELYSVYDKYVKFKQNIIKPVESIANNIFTKKVLGVHFRGQEMRYTPGHWFPPTKKQIKHAVDKMIDKYNYNKIFVVSEDAGLVEFLREEYNDILFSNNHFRTYGENAYTLKNVRHKHFFRLGEEIAIDCMLLARCNGLIACTSNVAEAARFIKKGGYDAQIKINNGPNNFRKNIYIRYAWHVKNLLPNFMGGFNIDFEITEKK